MKTRVIRYWHDTDWHYRVERYVCTEKDTPLYSMHGGLCATSIRKAGTWYWEHVAGGLSLAKAKEIAVAVANKQAYEKHEVVYEYGM